MPIFQLVLELQGKKPGCSASDQPVRNLDSGTKYGVFEWRITLLKGQF